MNKVFVEQIGRNIEVYVDDMVANTLEDKDHCLDLTEVFGQLRQHNMRLNLEKCASRVDARKFLNFLLTSRGIEANLDKCKVALDIRSLCNVK